jgi:hypothetical protein
MKKLINLFEADNYREYPEYSKILGKDTEDLLKGRAASKYEEKPENRTSPGEVGRIINAIMQAEKGYTDTLSDLAVTLVKEIIPAIDYFDLEIDAKIGNEAPPPEEGEIKWREEIIKHPDLDDSDIDKMRRLKNALSQGGSVSRLEFKIFKEFFDNIDEDLLRKYEEFTTKMFTGLYQSESIVQTFTDILKNMSGAGAETGWSKVLVPEMDDMDDEDVSKKITIIARAKCFPILVHEIIKGFLSYLADQISADTLSDEEKERAEREARQKVDTYINEPRDLMYGQNIYRIYDSFFKGLEEQTKISDPRLIDVFLSEMYLEYQKKPVEFNSFINNMLNGNLSPEQLNWAKAKYINLAKDLKDYDKRLSDEDETYSEEDGLVEQIIFSEEDELSTLQRKSKEYEKIFNGIMNFNPADLALDSLSTIDEDVDEIIRKKGNQYSLYSHSGKKLGTHTSKEKALRQERAIYANKNESKTTQCSCQHKHD